MPMHWSIEDGQTISWASLVGEGVATPVGLTFATDAGNTHNVQLVLGCDDGSSYVLTFNRNGLPQGPAVKLEPPPAPAPAAAPAAAETKGKSSRS